MLTCDVISLKKTTKKSSVQRHWLRKKSSYTQDQSKEHWCFSRIYERRQLKRNRAHSHRKEHFNDDNRNRNKKTEEYQKKRSGFDEVNLMIWTQKRRIVGDGYFHFPFCTLLSPSPSGSPVPAERKKMIYQADYIRFGPDSLSVHSGAVLITLSYILEKWQDNSTNDDWTLVRNIIVSKIFNLRNMISKFWLNMQCRL